MLLLCAVKMLRSGIERQFGPWVQAQFAAGHRSVSSLSRGAGMGFMMQGATAVVLMSGSLAAQGLVPVGSAMLVALGAELGSALAVNLLHLSTSSVGPLFLLIGGWMFLKVSDTHKVHNIGRVILGLGLIFLAMDLIRHAVAPLQTSGEVMVVFALIGTDPVNAMLFGLVLAFVMHSSLVAMLTAATFATNGDLSVTTALAFMLGCNIGSALLPIWLLRGEAPVALRVGQAVAVVRIGFGLCLLLALMLIPTDDLHLGSLGPIQAMLYGHLAFNLALWLFAPALKPLESYLFASSVSGEPSGGATDLTRTPNLAAATFKRQVNVMLETLGEMLETANRATPDAKQMGGLENGMNDCLTDIRQSYAALPKLEQATENQINTFLDYAIRIERAADLLAGKYMKIRHEEQIGLCRLSDSGNDEIVMQLTELRATMILAQHVFWKEDPHEARQLIQRKEQMTKLEQDHRRRHFARLRSQDPAELLSSNQYLEIIAALKEITSKLATIGYVVLDRHGGLKKTRLKAQN